MSKNNLSPENIPKEEDIESVKNNVGTKLLNQFGTRFLSLPQTEVQKDATKPVAKPSTLSESPQLQQSQSPQPSQVVQTPLNKLITQIPERYVLAIFMFISGFITIGLFAALAKTLQVPFIFPSLGASAFLFFFAPTSPSASPRNAILGHAIGIIAGYIPLVLFGLASMPAASTSNIDTSRILAVGVALGLAGALMIIFKCGHPPAGATALIVSLGIVAKPFSLIVLESAVIMLALLAIGINRLAGIDYPVWGRKPKEGVVIPWTPEKAAGTSPLAAITWATFFFVNGFVTIGILTSIAMILKIPFIFPSLGATAFLFFFGSNLPSASPRNAIFGNAVSILAGFIALNICGLAHVSSNIPTADIQHIISAALALALAGLLMILFKTPHPPAGATSLIVSLGLVVSPLRLVILEFAVVFLALQAIVINRLVAIDYPLWQKK